MFQKWYLRVSLRYRDWKLSHSRVEIWYHHSPVRDIDDSFSLGPLCASCRSSSEALVNIARRGGRRRECYCAKIQFRKYSYEISIPNWQSFYFNTVQRLLIQSSRPLDGCLGGGYCAKAEPISELRLNARLLCTIHHIAYNHIEIVIVIVDFVILNGFILKWLCNAFK